MKQDAIRFFEHQPMFMLDHETLDILDVNEAAIQSYKYSRDEFLQMNIFDLGQRGINDQIIKNFSSKDIPDCRLWKHSTKDGEVKYVQFTHHLFNYQGKPCRLVAAHDITEQILNNNGNEKAYKSLPATPSKLTNSPLAEIEWHSDYVVKDWSSKAEKLFGWTEKEVVGSEFFFEQFVHEEEQAIAYKNLNRAIQNNEVNYTVEGRNYTKDGKMLYCCWYNSLFFDDQDNLVSVYSLVHDISERKQSDNLFKALSEESLVGVYVIQDNMFKYVNPEFARIFQYEKSEIENKLGPKDLTYPDDWEKVRLNMNKRLYEEVDSLESDFRCITKHGQARHVNVYGSRIDYRGRPAVVGTLVDITDSKLAYERYRASVESFEDLFDSISDAIYIQNKDETFIKVNDAATALSGHSRDYLIGKSSEILAAPGKVDLEKSKTYLRKALNGESQHFEQWGIRKNGEVFPQEVVLKPGSYFGKDVVIRICRDISQRYETQKQLRKKEELFRQLFQNAPIGIVMMDEYQEVYLVNNAFEQIFGYTSDEISGYNIDKLIVPEEHEDEACELASQILEGVSVDVSTRRQRKDGSLIDVLVYGVPVTVDERTIANFGIYVDITERKDAEKQIRQSLREKEVLLAEIHHRVKNNLAVITGLLELQTYNTDSEDVQQVLYESQMRINSIALIHEKLYQSKDLSQISFDVYVEELTNIILSSISNQKDIGMELNIAAVHLTVNQAIPCGLILNELITNAFKHAFEDRKKGTIRIELKEEDRKLTLVVEDNGIGLPDDLDWNQSGSLGLSLIQTLSDQLMGSCSLENTKEGSRFILKFEPDELPE